MPDEKSKDRDELLLRVFLIPEYWGDETELLDLESDIKKITGDLFYKDFVSADERRELHKYDFVLTATHYVIEHPELRPIRDYLYDLSCRLDKRAVVPDPEEPGCLGAYIQPIELQEEWREYQKTHDIPEELMQLYHVFVEDQLYPVYE